MLAAYRVIGIKDRYGRFTEESLDCFSDERANYTIVSRTRSPVVCVSVSQEFIGRKICPPLKNVSQWQRKRDSDQRGLCLSVTRTISANTVPTVIIYEVSKATGYRSAGRGLIRESGASFLSSSALPGHREESSPARPTPVRSPAKSTEVYT